MRIFNVSPVELALILFVALVVMGPHEVVTMAGKLGQALRRLTRLPIWREMNAASLEINEVSENILHKTGLQDSLKEMNQLNDIQRENIKQGLSGENENNLVRGEEGWYGPLSGWPERKLPISRETENQIGASGELD